MIGREIVGGRRSPQRVTGWRSACRVCQDSAGNALTRAQHEVEELMRRDVEQTALNVPD